MLLIPDGTFSGRITAYEASSSTCLQDGPRRQFVLRPLSGTKVAIGTADPRAVQVAEIVTARIDELRKLSDNWDSYGARALNGRTLDYACELFASIVTPLIDPPSVVPSRRGGVQFEWHMNGMDLEIWTYAAGTFSFSFDGADGEPIEQIDLSDPSVLTPLLERVAR